MFSWDATKAERNYEKHGVSFEEAASVFFDSKALDWEDREHLEEEQRWKRLGFSWRARLILVVYTLRRLTDGTETTRIISARQASRQEREVYAG